MHFLLLGGLLFAAYFYLSPEGPSDNEILISAGQQKHLMTTFSRTWQRPPTAEEFQGLVDDWLREEIAYREGLAMGLDAGDIIIRRRLRQKVELLAEDIVSMVSPEDADLQQWLDSNPERYRLEPRYSLEQIYFSPDRRGSQVAADAEAALARLLSSGDAEDAATFGDPLQLPRMLNNERAGAIAGQFGSAFLEALQDVQMGSWDGPVVSGFGLHLVKVTAFEPGRPLTLTEARAQLERDWSSDQRKNAIDGLYERLGEQYTVTIEPLSAGDTDS